MLLWVFPQTISGLEEQSNPHQRKGNSFFHFLPLRIQVFCDPKTITDQFSGGRKLQQLQDSLPSPLSQHQALLWKTYTPVIIWPSQCLCEGAQISKVTKAHRLVNLLKITKSDSPFSI